MLLKKLSFYDDSTWLVAPAFHAASAAVTVLLTMNPKKMT
jgi:hypothetical protein